MAQRGRPDCATRPPIDLDEERKAAMVSNLLVVLCGDKSAQPVLNAEPRQ